MRLKEFLAEVKAVPEPKDGEKLAEYIDGNGYTVEIVWGLPNGVQEKALGVRRYGTMYITSPDGERVQGGYWMNWPEASWNIHKDRWKQIVYRVRAEYEVKQQATKYDSLKDQFEYFKKTRK